MRRAAIKARPVGPVLSQDLRAVNSSAGAAGPAAFARLTRPTVLTRRAVDRTSFDLTRSATPGAHW
jgi:hypothetical protein